MSSMPDLLRQNALINPLASQRAGLGMISARFCSSHPSPYCSLSIAKKPWRDWAELMKLIVRYNLSLVLSSRSGRSLDIDPRHFLITDHADLFLSRLRPDRFGPIGENC